MSVIVVGHFSVPDVAKAVESLTANAALLEGIVKNSGSTFPVGIKRCVAAGVRPRAEINRVEEADYYTALGVKDFNLSSDLAVLRAFYAQQGRALRERVTATSPA